MDLSFRSHGRRAPHISSRARSVGGSRLLPHGLGSVIDLSNITKAPATQRKALAAHLERFGQLSARWYAGAAVIVPSPWLRGIATAVTWLWPPKFPYELFSEPLDAEHWAKKQLATKLAQLG